MVITNLKVFPTPCELKFRIECTCGGVLLSKADLLCRVTPLSSLKLLPGEWRPQPSPPDTLLSSCSSLLLHPDLHQLLPSQGPCDVTLTVSHVTSALHICFLLCSFGNRVHHRCLVSSCPLPIGTHTVSTQTRPVFFSGVIMYCTVLYSALYTDSTEDSFPFFFFAGGGSKTLSL